MRVSQKYAKVLLIIILISFLTVSMAHSQQALSIDERIAVIEKKIEGGVARGDLTRNEYSRLKPRLAVVKYKRAQLDKPNATEQTYKDLDHYLYGLEMDTDRMINSLKRR